MYYKVRPSYYNVKHKTDNKAHKLLDCCTILYHTHTHGSLIIVCVTLLLICKLDDDRGRYCTL